MDTCFAKGEIISITANMLTVRLVVASACAGCTASLLCSAGKGRTIKVKAPVNSTFCVGDIIQMTTAQKKPLKIMFMLIFLSLFTGTLCSFLVHKAGASEVLSAAVFLAVSTFSGIAALFVFSRKSEQLYTIVK